MAPDHVAVKTRLIPLAYVFPPPLCSGKDVRSTLLEVNVICLLVMDTNRGLSAAICPRQTKLSGLRSLR